MISFYIVLIFNLFFEFAMTDGSRSTAKPEQFNIVVYAKRQSEARNIFLSQ